jgi:bacterioferritin-associated ferredoxin
VNGATTRHHAETLEKGLLARDVRGTLHPVVICHCERVNERTIRKLLRDPSITVDDVVAGCGAGGRCGGCRDSIEQLVAAGRDVPVVAHVAVS